MIRIIGFFYGIKKIDNQLTRVFDGKCKLPVRGLRSASLEDRGVSINRVAVQQGCNARLGFCILLIAHNA